MTIAWRLDDAFRQRLQRAMPVTRLGPRCPTCGQGPSIDDGPCHRCRLLARLTGRPPEPRSDPLVISSESPLFDAELERWMLGGTT